MFQYVSIISVSTIPSRILFPRFTFQYVSIISLLSPRHSFLPEAHLHSNMFLLFLYIAERLILCVQNLHSNMFLLFRSCLFDYCCRNNIYIPICFYYFDGVDMDIRETQIHLHSNMFLLFQIQVLGE